MKKLIMSLACVCLATSYASAQNCMTFFPANEGAMLVNRTYDSSNNLLYTTTYRVENAYDYTSGSDMQVSFLIKDNAENILSNGNLDASCMDGNFYLKMVNRTMSPEIMDVLGNSTELVGNFLDYPNTFGTDFTYNGPFEMTPGEYSIQSKNDKSESMRVKVYNRQYEKNENITTPVGTFNAAKISFNFDCVKDGQTNVHKGVEWYAEGAGIVRSETYDENGVLQNYTELTTLISN